jgi:hypothetical protein
MTAVPASQLLTQLGQSFPDLDKLIQDLKVSETELLELSKTTEVSTSVQLTVRLAAIRFQLLTAKLADAALTALSRLMACDKPEVARRACNTILTLAGLLPSKAPTPKPWQKPPHAPQGDGYPDRQHLPTGSATHPASSSQPNDQGPMTNDKNAITKQHLPAYSNPTPSAPSSIQNSEFNIQNSPSSPRPLDPKTLRPSDPRLSALLNACVMKPTAST